MYWTTFYYGDDFTLLRLVATPSSFLQLHLCHLSADVTLRKSDLDSILVFQPHSGFLARESIVPARPFIQRPVNQSKKELSFDFGAPTCLPDVRGTRPSIHTGPANMVAAPGA